LEGDFWEKTFSLEIVVIEMKEVRQALNELFDLIAL